MTDIYCDFKVDYTRIPIFTEIGVEQMKYPLIISIPHSGTVFPEEFWPHTLLNRNQLRSNEDIFVDEIVATLPEQGIATIKMDIARAFIDANRDKIELDAKMFYDYPADKIAIENHRCRFGLGLIHRIDADNNPIYRGLLSYGEVQQRIKNTYEVYHKRLEQLTAKCLRKFGVCLVLDCHSMPSKICNIIPDSPQIDFCIGDLFSQSCPPVFTEVLRSSLTEKGYMVTNNLPYSGAFTTFNYCQPRKKIYTMQLEINRAIYAQEKLFEKNNDFQRISQDTSQAIMDLAKKILDF